ncbi:MAG: 50S ribosomal protein L3 [DPANN group archaeon]|nr:50S ribosomal protein L3 [DPANN group archaeon]
MGHIKKKRPRRGSLAYWPRKRIRDVRGHVGTWPQPKDLKAPKLLGFCGYKAGMTSVNVIDNRPKALTKGEEVNYGVSIVETPPMKPFSVRLYSQTPYGLHLISETLADNLDKNLLRVINAVKKRNSTLQDLKAKLPQACRITVLVHTQPQSTGFGKKTPEILELPVAGGTIEEQFNYAVSIFGKDIQFADIFKQGDFVDARGATKGKGFQGMIKRYGIKLERHKAEKGQRHRSTMGPITPPRVGWWIAQSGQMGMHQRTEFNRQVLKISDAKTFNPNPVSGISHYGLVRGNFILIAGSIPGAKKRLVTFTHPARPRKNLHWQAPEIVTISRRSQQG